MVDHNLSRSQGSWEYGLGRYILLLIRWLFRSICKFSDKEEVIQKRRSEMKTQKIEIEFPVVDGYKYDFDETMKRGFLINNKGLETTISVDLVFKRSPRIPTDEDAKRRPRVRVWNKGGERKLEMTLVAVVNGGTFITLTNDHIAVVCHSYCELIEEEK